MTKELNIHTKWHKNPKIIGCIVLTVICFGVIGSCSNQKDEQRAQKAKQEQIIRKKKQVKEKLKPQKEQKQCHEHSIKKQKVKEEKIKDAKFFASFKEQNLYNKGFKHIKKDFSNNAVFVNQFTMNDGTKFKLVRVDYANPAFAFDNKPTIAIYDYDKNGKYSLCGNEIYHCDWQDKINEQKAQEKRQQDQERAEKVKHQREEQLEEQKEKEEQKKENYNPENIKAQAQGFGQSTDSRLSAFNIKGYEDCSS